MTIEAENEAFMLRVLTLFSITHADSYDSLFWRTDGDNAPVSFFANCSDEFTYATADLEPITPENVEDLEQALWDVQAAGGPIYLAITLFVARQRKLRLMPLMQLPETLKPLFDAVGPPRTSNDFPH